MRTKRHRLGQHFLRDERVVELIGGALGSEPPRVVEIGPGRGALTRLLAEQFEVVRAVEVDETLIPALRSAFAGGRVEIVHDDALTADLDALSGGLTWQVAANLPYSVGTPILRRLLRRGDLFPACVVMVQREVAERIVATPGSAARGLLSVEIELLARAELLFTVPPGAFSPPPKVESAVVRLVTGGFARRPGDVDLALALAGRAFTQRRKKLTNSLGGAAPAAAIAQALEAVGVVAGSRAQDVSVAQWLGLAGALERRGT